jgi:hypothetical protein
MAVQSDAHGCPSDADSRGRFKGCTRHTTLLSVRLGYWYSASLVRVTPDVISLQVCTPKDVGV